MFKHKLKICFWRTDDDKKNARLHLKSMNCRHSPVHPVSVPGSAAGHYTWFSPPLWFLWIHQDNMADGDTDQNTVSIYIWQAVTDLVGHSDLKYCAAVAVSDGIHFGRPASPHMLFTLHYEKLWFHSFDCKKKKQNILAEQPSARFLSLWAAHESTIA